MSDRPPWVDNWGSDRPISIGEARGCRSESLHTPPRVHAGATPHREAYDNRVKLVQEVEEDVRKAEGGNKAAGTRVRKIMQEIKQAAQDVRVAVLAARDDEG